LNKTVERLFGWWTAFDNPLVAWVVCLLVLVLLTSGAVIQVLWRSKRVDALLYAELWRRWLSWLWLTLIIVAPILLGAAWVMAAIAILSLACYREFARATGLFREKLISTCIVLGVLALSFACADNYGRLYFALAPLTVGLLAIVTIPQDRPKGYLQRTALGVMAFLLFGYGLGYLALLANYPDYRLVLLLVFLGVEANDVFAYCVGKSIGGPKILPNTSPHKTVAGCAGALVLTTILVAWLGHLVFFDTAADRLDVLVILGAGLSILGQFGDFLLSSVKRDLGIKDIGAVIPGHGGVLDRFNSLVLVPPALFHFLSLYLGPLNTKVAERLMTGG
jgi:phosphatidate cytidylyltransferase